MIGWLYWVFFAAVAVAVLAGPWLCAWLEDRAERRDAEVWAKQPGATR